jgi:hypothetical protein
MEKKLIYKPTFVLILIKTNDQSYVADTSTLFPLIRAFEKL